MQEEELTTIVRETIVTARVIDASDGWSPAGIGSGFVPESRRKTFSHRE